MTRTEDIKYLDHVRAEPSIDGILLRRFGLEKYLILYGIIIAAIIVVFLYAAVPLILSSFIK